MKTTEGRDGISSARYDVATGRGNGGRPQPEKTTEKKLSQEITISAMTMVMAKLSKLNIELLQSISNYALSIRAVTIFSFGRRHRVTIG